MLMTSQCGSDATSNARLCAQQLAETSRRQTRVGQRDAPVVARSHFSFLCGVHLWPQRQTGNEIFVSQTQTHSVAAKVVDVYTDKLQLNQIVSEHY